MTGATLSESYDPEELIPGSPSRLRAVGDSYLAAWQVSGGAIRALNTLRVAGWSGTAADAFSGSVAASAEVLTGTVPTLMDAYSALEDYRATLLSARSEASDLADRYRRSVNRSEAERDEHDAAARRAWDNGDPFGAVGEAMSEFVDLGIADRINMEMELIGIQRRVETAGDQAAETVRTCASAAPIPTPPPNFFQTIGDGFVQWTMGSYTAFSDAVVGTGELLWDISPVRAVSDLITYGPEGFIAQRLDAYGQVLDTAGAIVADPGAALTSFVGDFFAVDMWFTNPMRALGTVQANIGMLILPGGALTKLGTAGKVAGHVRVPVIRGLGDSPSRFPERLPEGDLKLPGKAPEVGELPGDNATMRGRHGPNQNMRAPRSAREIAAERMRLDGINAAKKAGADFTRRDSDEILDLGGHQFPLKSHNAKGTTKVFDTLELSDGELSSAVHEFAQKYTGGVELRSVGSYDPPTVWTARISNDINVTIRTKSSSEVDGALARWTLEINNKAPAGDGWGSRKIEFKFR